MYSGDVPAILSARKTYSFRGIELTLSCHPLWLFGRLRHSTTITPMSALVPLYVYVITPRRRDAGFFVSFCPRIAHGIFLLIWGSRAFYGASPSEKVCLYK